MAKKNVVEIVCDRCDRTEYIDPNQVSPLPDLELKFGAKPVEFNSTGANTTVMGPSYETEAKLDDLCSSCQKTVRNLVAQITKKISWKRDKAEGEGEETAG